MCKSAGIYSFGVSGASSVALLTLSGFGVGTEAEAGGFAIVDRRWLFRLESVSLQRRERTRADPPAVGTVTACSAVPGARQLAGFSGWMLLGRILLQAKRAGT